MSMDIEGLKGILLTIDNWFWIGYALTPKPLKGRNGQEMVSIDTEGFVLTPKTHDINDFVMRWTLRDCMVYFQLLTIDFGQICKYMFILYYICIYVMHIYS